MQVNVDGIFNFLIGGGALRIFLLLVMLILASVWDIRSRIIPDWMSYLIILISFVPIGHPHLLGAIVAFALLIAAVTVGGIGGGDIKIVASVGLVLGFEKTLEGLMLGLIFMIAFHLGYRVGRTWGQAIKKKKADKDKTAYPMIPFLTLGMAVSIFLF